METSHDERTFWRTILVHRFDYRIERWLRVQKSKIKREKKEVSEYLLCPSLSRAHFYTKIVLLEPWQANNQEERGAKECVWERRKMASPISNTQGSVSAFGSLESKYLLNYNIRVWFPVSKESPAELSHARHPNICLPRAFSSPSYIPQRATPSTGRNPVSLHRTFEHWCPYYVQGNFRACRCRWGGICVLVSLCEGKKQFRRLGLELGRNLRQRTWFRKAQKSMGCMYTLSRRFLHFV